MEYVWFGLSMFIALVAAFSLHEAWITYLNHKRIKERREFFKKINDIMIEDYADVDRVDEVAKEWLGE